MSSDPASDAQSTPVYPRQCSHMWVYLVTWGGAPCVTVEEGGHVSP